MPRLFKPIAALAALTTILLLPGSAAAKPKWTAYDRPATHEMVRETEVPIEMRDGVKLRANVYRPDSPGRFPVLITLTPYNKSLPLADGNRYLVERGYVHIVVDVRGTGSLRQGTWDSISAPREQKDGVEVVNWARPPALERRRPRPSSAPHIWRSRRSTPPPSGRRG